MARHTLSHAEDLYSGDAVMNGWLGSNRGLPIDQLILDDLGAPDVADINSLALAASAGNQATAQDALFILDGVKGSNSANVQGTVTQDVSRGIQIVSSDGGDTSQKAIVTGTDKFGNALTESISFNGTTIVFGKKAFKKVSQIQNTVAVMAGNVDIGSSDLIGLTYRCENAGDLVAVYEDGVLRTSRVVAAAAPAGVTAVAAAAATALQTEVQGSASLVAAASTALTITNTGNNITGSSGSGCTSGQVTEIDTLFDQIKVDLDATKVEVDRLVVENDDNKVVTDKLVLESTDYKATLDAEIVDVAAIVVEFDKLVLDVAAQKVELDKLILDVDLGTQGSFIKADKTAATTTTGDVRGTYNPVQANDGTRTLKLLIRPFARTSIGAYGVAQA